MTTHGTDVDTSWICLKVHSITKILSQVGKSLLVNIVILYIFGWMDDKIHVDQMLPKNHGNQWFLLNLMNIYITAWTNSCWSNTYKPKWLKFIGTRVWWVKGVLKLSEISVKVWYQFFNWYSHIIYQQGPRWLHTKPLSYPIQTQT